MKSAKARGVPALILSFAIAIASVASPAGSQESLDPPAQVNRAEDAEEIRSGTLSMLQALRETIKAKRDELASSEAALAETRDVETQTEFAEVIDRLGTEVRHLEADFEALATGLDLEEFRADLRSRMDVREELEDLFRPFLEALKSATETPRQIEKLRGDLEQLGERESMADRAISRLELLLEQNEDPALGRTMTTLLEGWKGDRRQIENQTRIVEFQLERLLENRRSLLESSGDLTSTFFRSRGLHLGMALGAFIAVFVGFRVVYYLIGRVRRGRERSFYSRLTRVLFFFTAFFAATLAMLLVLYAAGDWFLLSLVLIFLAGLGWAGRQAIPRSLDQVRMLLNLGPVRENERVVIDGIPWRVATLNLYSTLINPAMAGRKIRKSINSLMSMESRPFKQDDVWFPCREEDWVRLSDDTRGRVVYQGPEFVQLFRKGGALITYPTADFLALHPKNLSADFRISETFGIDYQHQAICTGEVPKKMRSALEEGLAKLAGADNLNKVGVEFKSAGASSLDYAVLADFSGAVAEKADVLQRAIQRILVDVCNEEGWNIPFTQVTVHQA